MTLRNKFLELRFCMCEDESQIDNFVDVADDFAICFAEWLYSLEENYLHILGLYEFNKKYRDKTFLELLEIYKLTTGL